MCPRLFKKKVNVSDPSKLIPELPSPNDLKPFPTQVSIDFNFHTTCVRSIAVSPNGAYLASGDEDSNCVIWCVKTSKIVRKYKLRNKVVDKLQWCPNTDYYILAIANEENVHLIAPALSTREVNSSTIQLLNASSKLSQIEQAAADKKESVCNWEFINLEVRGQQMMVTLTLKHVISNVCWHPKGDYLATMAHNLQATSQVLIHSVSKASS